MSEKKLWNYFPRTISKAQASDTGMAVVLIFLLIGLYTKDNLYFKIATPVLIMNMIFPKFYSPFAFIWLGFSQLLGTVMSKIILTVVYVLLIIPVGLFRRLIGKDSLQLSKFKKGKTSVMKKRNYIFSSKDIQYPY